MNFQAVYLEVIRITHTGCGVAHVCQVKGGLWLGDHQNQILRKRHCCGCRPATEVLSAKISFRHAKREFGYGFTVRRLQ